MSENDRNPTGSGEEVREGVGPVQPMDPARRQARPEEAPASAPPPRPPANEPPSSPERRPSTPPSGPPGRAPAPGGRSGPRRLRPSAVGAVDRVRGTDFPIVLRGYDRAAVDAYVADVAQLVAELEATQLPETVVERALDDVGEQTSAILKRAHEAAEEIATRSRAQADARIDRAEQEAEQTRREAEEHVRRLEGDLRSIWEERQRLIEDVRHLADDVLALADDAIDRIPPPGEDEETADDAEQTQTLAREDVAAELASGEPSEPGPPDGTASQPDEPTGPTGELASQDEDTADRPPGP